MEVENKFAKLHLELETAFSFYSENPLPDARKAMPYLEAIESRLRDFESDKCDVVQFVERYLTRQPVHSVFLIHTLEFCFRKLEWQEGFDSLVRINESFEDSGLAFKVEQIIRRIYDPNWEGGIARLGEGEQMPPSVWDLIEDEEPSPA